MSSAFKKLNLVFLLLLFAGRAKFSFSFSGSSLLSTLSINSPIDNSAFIAGDPMTIQGNCDPDGGVVEISGTSIVEVLLQGNCDVNGTYSVVGTGVPGVSLNLSASQVDADGQPLSDLVVNLKSHCADLAMINCSLSGSGNPSDPYIVDNITCLQEMRTGLNCEYALNNSIDATATQTWNPAGGGAFDGWEPIPNSPDPAVTFTGSLDGRGHTISNLYITPRIGDVGLFTRIGDRNSDFIVDIQVRDLTIDNVTIERFGLESEFGVLSGEITTAGVSNINISNTTINYDNDLQITAGGVLFGKAIGASIQNSTTSGVINLDGSNPLNPVVDWINIGGFIGVLENGSTVTNSTSSISIFAANGNRHALTRIGGSFGYINGSQVTTFLSQGTISLENTFNDPSSFRLELSGGFAGEAEAATISGVCSRASFEGSVSIADIIHVGGLIGLVNNSTLSLMGVHGSVDASATGVGAITTLMGGAFGEVSGGSALNDILSTNATISNSDSLNGTGGFAGGIGPNVTVERVLRYNNVNLVGSSSQLNTGAVVGQSFPAVYTSVFYANDPAMVGGLSDVGSGSNAGITGDTAINIANYPNGNFTGWDFVGVWDRNALPDLPFIIGCAP